MAEKMAVSPDSKEAALAELVGISAPTMPLAAERMMPPKTPQSNNWVMPTSATPIILPIMSSKGRTLDTMISMMRLVFSSITPCMTIPP